MGYPVVQALYGDSAIFYITIFNMPFSILFFSMGLHLLKKDAAIASGNFVKEKLNLRSFINNGIIASVASLVIYFANIPMPDIFYACVGFVGNITVALYNETPKHRDNFIKLVKEGVYDSTLFHRVIKQFMIQAGDPDSKNASDTAMLGSGDVGYTIPAEFNPKFFHKKGVLAAARQGDDVNPEKASSGCQFYIVTGRKFTEPQLLGMENKINEQREEALFDSLARQHMKEIYKMRKAGDNAGLLELQDTLEAQARELADKEEKFRFTPEQIKAYSTIGGAPHLDGSYTVFGEVTEGMEVVDNIEIAKTNRADRPIENIRILKASIQ